MTAPDRVELINGQARVTGIDFIYVHPNQTMLDVYFLRPPAGVVTPSPLVGALNPADIDIYSPTGDAPAITVAFLNWMIIDGQDVLRLTTARVGDFSLYKLKINDLRLDTFYNDITFDFKANCPSDLDCAPSPHECPPDAWVDFPIDYLARDFWSFRRALLDFASLRYPDWPDRLEADAGVMLAEVMSALGDEMAYYQDRTAREAYLQTATQRRSLRRHAHLVDYNLHDGLGANGWLDVQVETGKTVQLDAGTNVFAAGESGYRTNFEIGHGLEEFFAKKQYTVTDAMNAFEPHIWDETAVCLPIGATELYIEGHHKAVLAFDDFPIGKKAGKWVMLQPNPINPAQPIRIHVVRLIEITNTTDAVLNVPITRLVWEQAQATPFEMDMTILRVRGNIIPITAGETYENYFVTGENLSAFSADEREAFHQISLTIPVSRAIERVGRDNTIVYLLTLTESTQQSLVWLGNTPTKAEPEIILHEMVFNKTRLEWEAKAKWIYRRSFIGTNSSQSEDEHFTLDDGTWQRVVGYQRIGEEIVHKDYASNQGVTIRFGDGQFGRIPEEKSVFRATYRLGNGRRTNVAAHSVTRFESITDVKSITNPLPTEGGLDTETSDELRQLAPDAFRAITYRAVRPEDYAEAAERLDWVQRAGATFRWTGSWLTAFVTPDPRGAVVVSEEHRKDLTRQLGRFRQAGREAYMKPPVYANLDLEIEICVEPTSYQSEVKARVKEVLLGKKGILSKIGYFSADNFTFGTPLERSTLEAVIQATPGVRAVESIRFRRRGWFEWQALTTFSYNAGDNVIIRVENDPLHPERGSLKLYTHGGA
jgi:Baseplate J-like protein